MCMALNLLLVLACNVMWRTLCNRACVVGLREEASCGVCEIIIENGDICCDPHPSLRVFTEFAHARERSSLDKRSLFSLSVESGGHLAILCSQGRKSECTFWATILAIKLLQQGFCIARALPTFAAP